jgi:ABC-type nitrate/sulfonate/bicarbonate transport system substrate-binding protein
MRNRMTGLITIAAVVLAIVGCGSSKSSGQSDAKTTSSAAPAGVASAKGSSLVMGDFLGPYTVDVAKREGLLSNLHVKLADQASGAAALPLMLSGRMDGVTDIGVPPLVTAAAKNVPLKIVWYAGADPGGVYVKPSIQTAKGMAGQNIAAPTGSIAEISLAEYLQQEGVKFSQVKLVNLPPPSIVASYKTGQIAGASIWTPITTGLRAAGAKLMANQPETAFTVFTSAFIKAHASAVQLYLCDIAKAQDLRRSDAKRVYADLAPLEGASAAGVEAEMPTNPASNQATPDLMGTAGQPPAKWVTQLVAAGRTMTQLKLIPTAPSTAKIQSMFDPQFAQFIAAGKCPK